MHQIPNKVDFYITNVCNLTCERCNRFNNFDFKGWQKWSDYEETYARWSQLVQLRAITIMGGEPFLNPTLSDWVQNLNRLFEIEIQILTNGSRFSHAKNLYQHMLYRSPQTQARNHIGVSLHNMNDFEKLDQDIRDWLEGPVKMLPKGENQWNSDWHYIDRNGIMVNVYISNNFGNAAIRVPEAGRFILHNNDINAAHQNCAFVKWKSYHLFAANFINVARLRLCPSLIVNIHLTSAMKTDSC
jgi:hypothetical protein